MDTQQRDEIVETLTDTAADMLAYSGNYLTPYDRDEFREILQHYLSTFIDSVEA